MSDRMFQCFSLAFVCLQVIVVACRSASAEQPPNIVFIMADDMGIGDAGCYNAASKIPTPNIDRLAAEGMRFTDAHSPCAVCTPTRYGVLTGRYSWRTRLKSGVLWGYSRSLIEPERLTVAALLKNQGYQTACVGKWHLGFQSVNVGGGGPPSDRPDLRADHPHAVDYSQPLRPGPVTVGFDYFFGIPASLDMVPYLFIENDQPVEPPTAVLEGSTNRREGGGGFWRTGPAPPGFHPVQYDHWANLRYRGQKADIWEGGHRVPYVARWPQHAPPASTCDQTICLTDLLATAAALTGADVPDDAAEDSFDISPLLKGKSAPVRDATVHHAMDGTFAIRVGRWKLIEGNLGSGGFTQPGKEGKTGGNGD